MSGNTNDWQNRERESGMSKSATGTLQEKFGDAAKHSWMHRMNPIASVSGPNVSDAKTENSCPKETRAIQTYLVRYFHALFFSSNFKLLCKLLSYT